MKSIFIAGPRAIKKLNNKVLIKLKRLEENNFTIYVGDANGVDKLIQDFYHSLKYRNVTIFSSNSIPRNNLGNWNVNVINVDKSIKGFDFYAQKDKAMAKQADLGFMIWNGKSKGTLNNIINLRNENKKIILFLTPLEKFFVINTDKELQNIIRSLSDDVQKLYSELLRNSLVKSKNQAEQLSMIV